MSIRLVGVLILSVLFTSCKNEGEKVNKSKSRNDIRIEFTDSYGNKISKEELERSTGTFNYEIFGIDGVSDLAKSLHKEARVSGQKRDNNSRNLNFR